MACPYFLPQAELETGPWTHEPRWPLGAAFAGVCRARPDEFHQPPESHQEELCNCGYARGVCDRFPQDAPADAVRFSVTADEPGPFRIVYILEKDHAPVEFDTLEFSPAKTLLTPVANQILARQADAFLQSRLTFAARVSSAC